MNVSAVEDLGRGPESKADVVQPKDAAELAQRHTEGLMTAFTASVFMGALATFLHTN